MECGTNSLNALGEVEDFLYTLRNAGSKYSLERIRKFAAAIGNPQEAYPLIHVAGTNGKGSVCAMLESILRGGGLTTGMFTSPHLVYLGERVEFDRVPIQKGKLISSVFELRKIADKLFSFADIQNYPSFFEFMTVLAFDEFKRGKVDVAVVEVGLGGRLDSTNIVEPELSVITSIGLDHTALLGNTLAEIAREKAGIIKCGVPVVCGFLPEEAMIVVERVALEKSAPIYKVADFFKDENSLPLTNLKGLYQRRNAAIATLAAKVLRESVPSKKWKKPLDFLDEVSVKNALSNVSWAARWEEFSLENGARLILDSSHNEEGARALDENLAELAKAGVRPVIALGVLGKERAVPLLSVAAKYARELVFLVPNQPRALSFEELAQCMPQMSHSVKVTHSSVEEFYAQKKYAEFVKAGDTLVSTGSIYLAGEVIAALNHLRSDGLQDRPYKNI